MEIIKRLLHKKVTPEPAEPTTKRKIMPINPVREPDLARLQDIWTTPDVLNGTLEIRLKDGSGTHIIDFDHRDSSMRPTSRFIPETNKGV